MRPEYIHREEPLECDPDRHRTLCRVPVFRPVAAKLLQLLGNEDVSVHEVSKLLNSDPGFSTEMLTMANSAAYGSSRRIYTIEKAVVLLGLDRTRGLATRTALDSMVRGLGGSPTIQNCWRHSLATALIAKWLAPFYRLHPDLIYTTGLMHDVGRLGLLAAEPQQYSKLLASVEGTSEDMLLVERWAFRVDHCEAGLFLTKTWGLPEEFWLPSSQHHAARNPITARNVDIIRLACGLADALGYKAAPMVQAELPEALLGQIPDLGHTREDSPLSSLSQLLEKELGDVSEVAQAGERFECKIVN
jgi:HD-like signal output (HDOD) protein